MYKMNFLSNLLLSALVLAIGHSDDQIEDCTVYSKLGCDITSRDNFEWKAYFTNDTKLEIYVAFVEKEEVSDSDCIHFKMNEVYRDKKRNHKYIDIELLPKSPLSLEWSNFSMLVVEKGTIKVMINSVEFPIEFDFPVRYLSIISENVAACSNGSPTWKITEGRNSTIPINQHENVHFSLYSNKSFSPAFYMNNLLINLQYSSGVEIGNSIKSYPLPEGIYDFNLRKQSNTWILLHEKPNEDPELLLEFKMTDKLSNISLTSFEEDFQFQLKSTNLDHAKGVSIITVTINNEHSAMEVLMIILIVLLLCIILLIILLFVYKKRQENNYLTHPEWKENVITEKRQFIQQNAA